ncbi:MAG: flavin reductase, partial [Actinomycetota bacterium]
EIAYAGLTPASSSLVHPPCIAECAAWFECELEWEKDAGDHVIIVGRVVNAEARDEFVKDGGFDFAVAKPLLHVGGRNFTIGERRVVAKPKA